MLLGFSYLYVCNVFLQKADHFFFVFAYSSVGRTRKPTN